MIGMTRRPDVVEEIEPGILTKSRNASVGTTAVAMVRFDSAQVDFPGCHTSYRASMPEVLARSKKLEECLLAAGGMTDGTEITPGRAERGRSCRV